MTMKNTQDALGRAQLDEAMMSGLVVRNALMSRRGFVAASAVALAGFALAGCESGAQQEPPAESQDGSEQPSQEPQAQAEAEPAPAAPKPQPRPGPCSRFRTHIPPPARRRRSPSGACAGPAPVRTWRPQACSRFRSGPGSALPEASRHIWWPCRRSPSATSTAPPPDRPGQWPSPLPGYCLSRWWSREM